MRIDQTWLDYLKIAAACGIVFVAKGARAYLTGFLLLGCKVSVT